MILKNCYKELVGENLYSRLSIIVKVIHHHFVAFADFVRKVDPRLIEENE